MIKTIVKTLAIIYAFSYVQGASAQVGEPSKASIANMKTEEFTYTTGGVTQKGYVAYVPNTKQRLPVVLVVPEWWGYNEYVKMRARKLAELGYLAMVVDMYGDGKEAKTVEDAQKYSAEFYKDPRLAKVRLESAEAKARTFTEADPRRIAAIGYCFGGTMVLEAATEGMDLRAVVSFHGGLKGVTPGKVGIKTKILVCHGAADKFVSDEDVKEFKKRMDSAGVRYAFRSYPNATGKKFNLPIAYNEEADKASWQDMKRFLRDAFYMK
jgi:dienelactone hydrolase